MTTMSQRQSGSCLIWMARANKTQRERWLTCSLEDGEPDDKKPKRGAVHQWFKLSQQWFRFKYVIIPINKKSIWIVDHPLLIWIDTRNSEVIFFLHIFTELLCKDFFSLTGTIKYSDTELLKFVCTKLVAEHSYEFIYVVANALALT